MKPDDFENQLQRQPWRRLPADWRDDILMAARQAGADWPAAPESSATRWWRELFWPSPLAWAGTAACWGLIFALNLESSTAWTGTQSLHTTVPPAGVIRLALAERRHLLSSLADLPAASPNQPPVSLRPRPRSERPLDQLLG